MHIRWKSALAVAAVLFAGAASAQDLDLEADFDRHSKRVVARDSFPVLDHPNMATVKQARARLRDNDWVIGVAIKGEAKAYPIAVMGRHELANDTIGGHPAAVSW